MFQTTGNHEKMEQSSASECELMKWIHIKINKFWYNCQPKINTQKSFYSNSSINEWKIKVNPF